MYRKPAGSPGLVASARVQDDRNAAITRAEFLAHAWRAASEKARELGWIV
jgi:hypothetical protein